MTMWEHTLYQRDFYPGRVMGSTELAPTAPLAPHPLAVPPDQIPDPDLDPEFGEDADNIKSASMVI